MKNKRGEYLFLSYSTYSFIALFAFALLVLFFVEVRDDSITIRKYNTDFHIPEVILLTPEEVEVERFKLVTLSDKPIYTEPTDGRTSNQQNQISPSPTNGSVQTINEESVSHNNNSHLVFLSEDEIEMIKSRGVITIDNNSSVNKNSNLGDTTNIFSLEGSIFSKDDSSHSIRIALKNNGGLATINLNEDTNILINGKKSLSMI